VLPLVRANVCCAKPDFIVVWLAKPTVDLKPFLLHKMKMGPALSKMAAERRLSLDPAQSASL
jgi:hypothetical protein